MDKNNEPKIILDPDAAEYFDAGPSHLTELYAGKLAAISKEMKKNYPKGFMPSPLHNISMIDSLKAPKFAPMMVSKEKSYGKSSIGVAGVLAKLASEGLVINAADGSMSHEEEVAVDPVIKEWIDEHVEISQGTSYASYVDISIEPGDELAKERSEDIIRALYKGTLPYRYRHEKDKDLDDLLAYSCGLGELSPEFAKEMIAKGMLQTVLSRPDLFPALRYDRSLLDEIMTAGRLQDLQNEYDIFSSFSAEDWQAVADDMVADGRHNDLMSVLCVEASRARFELSLEQIIKLVKLCPDDTHYYLKDKGGEDLKKRYSGGTIMAAFHEAQKEPTAYAAGLAKNLTKDEIYEIAGADRVRVNNMLRYATHIDMFKSEEFLNGFLDDFENFEISLLRCSLYSEQLQSRIFDMRKNVFSMPGHLNTMLTKDFGFTKLSEDCHNYLIDECGVAIKKLGSMQVAVHMFAKTGATIATMKRLDEEYSEYFMQVERSRREALRENDYRKDRRGAEQTYLSNESIILQLAEAGVQLTPELIAEHFEYDHVVRMAPNLRDQLIDDTRVNDITCLTYDIRSYTMSESEMLREFDSQVRAMIQRHDLAWKSVAQLQSLYDNLTFIGNKEYQEAVTAIATYWKHMLDTDPELQILVYTGIGTGNKIKSDQYMFDKILDHFTDEELMKHKGRLVNDEAHVRRAEPGHLKVILLDDWTISGSQLRSAASNYVYQYPQFEQCMEVQLIAASKERIALGLEGVHYMKHGVDSENVPVPVRAYYLAHDAPAVRDDDAKGAHITGAHSSVDYGFENLITHYRTSMNKNTIPLTRVVREYREDGFRLANIERLTQVTEGERR